MILIGAGDDAAAFARAVRDAAGPAVIVAVAADVPPVERAAMLAMVAPLALELAPARRLAAIAIGPGADTAAIEQCVHYLRDAPAVTGQIVAIGG